MERSMVKKFKGRNKIKIAKIEKASNLQVTFSKRKSGLFKKASELCTLCGVQIMMIVFSPGGRAFSFGYPNVKDLIYRFFSYNYNSLFLRQNITPQIHEIPPDEDIKHLNDILTEEQEKEEDETNKSMGLDKIEEVREKKRNWFEKDIKDLDLNETNQLISALEDMKKKLISMYFQNHFGESSGNIITQGGNVEVGSDHLGQRGMVDPNAINYDPYMNLANNNNDVPRSNMDHMSNFNQN